jgi:N-acetylmuramic acid 6-phosphate etherase
MMMCSREVGDGPMTGETNLGALATEAVRSGGLDLGATSTPLLVAMMADDLADVQAAVRGASEAIARAIDRIVARMRARGRLIYLGAGTSGRLALMDAAECVPTFATGPGQVVALLAGGAQAAGSAVEGAEDDPLEAQRLLAELKLGPLDAVVGLSASGVTPFVLGGVARAAEVGALTVGISCNAGSALSSAAEIAIELLVGPELVAGSTRLKSGTAQKVVLNAISTITMVRLGKTYRNLMVDVRPTNAKLRNRSARIVGVITGAGERAVLEALRAADGDTKAAIVMIRNGLPPAAARALLQECQGSLRAALGEDGQPPPLEPYACHDE